MANVPATLKEREKLTGAGQTCEFDTNNRENQVLRGKDEEKRGDGKAW